MHMLVKWNQSWRSKAADCPCSTFGQSRFLILDEATSALIIKPNQMYCMLLKLLAGIHTVIAHPGFQQFNDVIEFLSLQMGIVANGSFEELILTSPSFKNWSNLNEIIFDK